ncbi:5-hydroxytryptamine receptor 1A [Holothuria leucospilota]|uniref:5-hydroxytryptamine receptor 1A n=1 Tax=Holothuria leucospilota TaxID=206669 RepID=A0A9Q1H2J2_HOLLE|nr:5-hydroxytryptamine receptor 1A [Holothuria leucospilota]
MTSTNTLSLFILLQILVALFGVVGNILVLIVIFQARDILKNQTNFLIGNQSAADLFSSIQLIFFQVEYFTNWPSPVPGSIWSKLYCFFWQQRLLLFGSYAISTFNLTILSLERYFAVVHPQMYLARSRKRLFSFMGLGTWLLGPVMQITFIVAHVYYKDGACFVRPSAPFIGVAIFLWDYFIPVGVMTFCFFRVFFKFRTLARIQGNWNAELSVAPSSAAPSSAAPSSAVSNEGGTTRAATTSDPASQDVTEGNNSAKTVTGNTLAVPEVNIPGSARKSDKNKGKSLQRRNATLTILIVYIAYVICWTPNQFGFLQYNLGGSIDWHGLFYQIELIMASSNSGINIVIYALRFKTFQTGIKKLFKCEGS